MTRERGGGEPYLWGDDASIHEGWLPENLDFLKTTLTPDYVSAKTAEAAERLRGEPEEEVARRIADDLPRCRDLVELRAEELPKLLSRCDGYILDWSV